MQLQTIILLLLSTSIAEALYGGGVWPCVDCDTSTEAGCDAGDQTCLTEAEAAFPIREILQPGSPLYADLQTLVITYTSFFSAPSSISFFSFPCFLLYNVF